jgi:ABC-type uncharacterized transport system permease subunit
MIATASGIIAVIFYILGSFFQSQNLTSENYQRKNVLLCGAVALVAHLINVIQVISTPAGYDFGFFKIATLFSWSIAALVLLSSLKKPLDNLFLALFPLAIISIICSLVLPSTYTPHTDYTAGVLLHIVLAILAVSIITIAAFQSLLIAIVNHQLKHRQAFSLISHLPPLQTMEALLFDIVWVGLFLLTGVIVSGILFMDDFFGQHLSHKTVLSLISWVVFAILLWGRHQLGWRGNTAIRWTLTGFVFLILAYFGSKFVLELILERS